MEIPTKEEVRLALQEVDRLQAVMNRTKADLDRWNGWQERMVRLEAHDRATHALFGHLEKLERTGILLYSEIMGFHVAQQGAGVTQKAS